MTCLLCKCAIDILCYALVIAYFCAKVRAMSSPDAPSDLTGQTSAPSKKRCDRRSTISAYNEAALGIAVTCGTPQSDVSTDVDTSEVDTGGAASGHSSGQKSSKVSRSKSSKLRSRSKSPGRRTLAKSLSSVAIDRFQVDVSKEKSLTSSNVPATADASLNTTKPEAQRSTSNNTTKLSSKSSTSRKNQAAATPASSSNAEQGLNSFAVSSSIASNDSSNLTDVANVIANNEEIFHEQVRIRHIPEVAEYTPSLLPTFCQNQRGGGAFTLYWYRAICHSPGDIYSALVLKIWRVICHLPKPGSNPHYCTRCSMYTMRFVRVLSRRCGCGYSFNAYFPGVVIHPPTY